MPGTAPQTPASATRSSAWVRTRGTVAGLDAELAGLVDEIGTAQVAHGTGQFLGTEREE